MAAHVGLLLLLSLGVAGGGYAQSLDSDARGRLSPRLEAVATEPTTARALSPLLSPVSRGARSDAAPPRYGVFVHARDAEALRASDRPLHPVGDALFTARLTPAGLRRVARLEAVEYVEAARRYAPLNDLVRAATGAHALQDGTLGRAYTGDDVLACVVDTGIDWAHPDFRGDDGTSTRIRALWDQTLAPQSGEESPAGIGYGVEYTRQALEQALEAPARSAVRSTDAEGHGTHVAATIAGGGRAGTAGTHRGMAPEAGIVAVKTDFTGVGIADGLRYCRSVAERAGQPVVANLSLGALRGPHDGTSPLARAVDAFTGPGRSVVAAAGNDGDAGRHWSRSLPAGATDSLTIRVPPYTPRDGAGNDVAFRLDAWIDGPARPAAVITPEGTRLPLAPDTAAARSSDAGTVVYAQSAPPAGGHHLEILAHDASGAAPPAAGTWSLVLENAASRAATVHAWMTETTVESRLPGGDAQSTLTVPATARSALTVGAWTHRGRWQTETGADVTSDRGRVGAVAPFSSRGPTRTGAPKPDLLAPGQWTISARSRTASPPDPQRLADGSYALLQGTSTASAAAAGAVALLLEETPSLSPSQTTRLLTETARPRTASSRAWTARRGHGRLDVFGAMARLRGTPVAARSDAAAPPSATGEGRTPLSLGGSAPVVSTPFTPARSGDVDGLLLPTGPGSSTRLRDSLTVSIWTDRDGRPGRPVGTPVRVAPSTLGPHTTNFVPLTATDAVVRADTTYHVVLQTAPDAGGELVLMGARRGSERRSLRRTDGSWTPLSTTLDLRVTTAFALDLTAPQLEGPPSSSIQQAPEAPTLSWRAVPNAETYVVQVSASPQFAPARTDTLRTAATSLRPTGLTPSTGYHWRVRAERLGYAGPWSTARSFLYYPTTIDVRAAQTFAEGRSGPGYRLVALPGQGPSPLARTVEGRAGDAWMAYRERGRGAEGLVPFDGSSTFRFRPGTGFWLRSDRPWRVRRSVPAVPLREDGSYTLELHDGWNIISNPFDLDVAWAAVAAANDGPLAPLWRFDGQFERTSTFSSAGTGRAFYFLNDEGRESLRIPYPAFPGTSARRTSSSGSSSPPALTLTTVRDGTPTSRVRVGAHDDAADGRDPYDEVAPPPRFAQTSLRVRASAPDTPPRRQHLAADYRSSAADGHTFSLTLRAPADAPVEIRAAGLKVFDGQEVVLVDPTAGESYDLRASATVTLRPEDSPRSLRLLVGSSDYVETKQEVTLPSELQFLPNYPNPFSDQTTLEYVLPDPARVRLVVYDVLGRQVRVLVDGKQEAGRHTVQWNGRGESGQRMASGMYLARLVVGETINVRKMTFVR